METYAFNWRYSFLTNFGRIICSKNHLYSGEFFVVGIKVIKTVFSNFRLAPFVLNISSTNNSMMTISRYRGMLSFIGVRNTMLTGTFHNIQSKRNGRTGSDGQHGGADGGDADEDNRGGSLATTTTLETVCP